MTAASLPRPIARRTFLDWVDQYLAARRARGGESDDVVGVMLAARDADGNGMSDSALRDELLTLLVSGHGTTGTALAWALYELGRHPAVRLRLRSELESAGIDADPGAIAKLPYLSAVCNETLRLHTILSEAPRLCVAPLECLGYTIPAGHGVVVSIMAIHHDPRIYSQPDEFIPQRFLERTYSPFEFLPFGGGDRRCLGSGLADYELRLALADMVLRWDFEPAAEEREIRHDISMGPKYGVPLRITARRQLACADDRSAAPLRRTHA